MNHLLLLGVATAIGLSTTSASIYQPVTPKTDKKLGRILIISGDKFNDTELLYPYYRLLEEGYEVTIASPKGGKITGSHSAEIPGTVKLSDLTSRLQEFVGLYLPGGKAPSKIRDNDEVIKVTQWFMGENKPVGAVCHGPQILVTADAVRGKKLTCVEEVAKEVTDAGGNYVDDAVVVDGNLVTSRLPGDLPSQLPVFIEVLKKSVK